MRIRTDGLAVQDLDGALIVLDLTTSRYLTVNPSALPLWRLLERGSDEAAMDAALGAEFGVDAERAAGDVAAFVAQLRAADLIVDDAESSDQAVAM